MIVYLDSNIVIYAVENPPVWGADDTHLSSFSALAIDVLT